MKNLSLLVVALLLASPVLANEVQNQAEPLLILNAVDMNASNDAQNVEATDLGAFLDKKVQEVSDLISAKIAAELPALVSQKTAANVKF